MKIALLFLDFETDIKSIKENEYWKDKITLNFDEESQSKIDLSFKIKQVKNLSHFYKDSKLLKDEILEYLSNSFIIDSKIDLTNNNDYQLTCYIEISFLISEIKRKKISLEELENKSKNEINIKNFSKEILPEGFKKHPNKSVSSLMKQDINYINWLYFHFEWFDLDHEDFIKLPYIKNYINTIYKEEINKTESLLLDYNEFEYFQYKFPNKKFPENFNYLKYFYDYGNFIYNLKKWYKNIEKELKSRWDSKDSLKYNNPNFMDNSYKDDWLEQASGTTNPDTMNDVFWNLD
ncbi:hypothetical protein Q4517_12260 [Tenacibaculum sp. 1_MG-2023]|uniref:hypothetical protein n=1 Tax=Tenacibaculum sp. 1_MG-2023 TaxID=3062653 RepID=UPI0026E37882|nr:hypothetical protein [Tenacibaculum sp. 1_MG-2023]MDO6676318.1 hypothetical protein [Tenacibaculum sp. 1_MG-2023]